MTRCLLHAQYAEILRVRLLLTRVAADRHVMGDPMTLLLVDDSARDAILLEEQLFDSMGDGVTVEYAASLRAALERVVKGGVDGILLSLYLPDSSGLETFERVAEAHPTLAIIVMTGRDDARAAERAVRLGARGHVVKDEATPAKLARAVTNAVRGRGAKCPRTRALDRRSARVECGRPRRHTI